MPAHLSRSLDRVEVGTEIAFTFSFACVEKIEDVNSLP